MFRVTGAGGTAGRRSIDAIAGLTGARAESGITLLAMHPIPMRTAALPSLAPRRSTARNLWPMECRRGVRRRLGRDPGCSQTASSVASLPRAASNDASVHFRIPPPCGRPFYSAWPILVRPTWRADVAAMRRLLKVLEPGRPKRVAMPRAEADHAQAIKTPCNRRRAPHDPSRCDGAIAT